MLKSDWLGGPVRDYLADTGCTGQPDFVVSRGQPSLSAHGPLKHWFCSSTSRPPSLCLPFGGSIEDVIVNTWGQACPVAPTAVFLPGLPDFRWRTKLVARGRRSYKVALVPVAPEVDFNWLLR